MTGGTNPADNPAGPLGGPGTAVMRRAVGLPFRKGYDPRRGRCPKGKGGPKPKAFRRKLLAILNSPQVRREVCAILQDRNHPHFAALWRATAAQALGHPLSTAPLPAQLPAGLKPQVHVYLPSNGRAPTLGAGSDPRGPRD